MNRRVLGRGRLLAGLGALLTLVACFLPWYTVGGAAGGLPAISANAFDGAGIVVFVVAVAALALIALPYAAGDQPIALDRPASFLALAVVGLVGYGARVVQLWSQEALGLPDRASGLWLAGLGLLILLWGAIETTREHERA
ncbi:MAG: hypothetical protein ACXVAE_02305 [Candidatus Limnocylindrales bacterium]